MKLDQMLLAWGDNMMSSTLYVVDCKVSWSKTKVKVKIMKRFKLFLQANFSPIIIQCLIPTFICEKQMWSFSLGIVYFNHELSVVYLLPTCLIYNIINFMYSMIYMPQNLYENKQVMVIYIKLDCLRSNRGTASIDFICCITHNV